MPDTAPIRRFEHRLVQLGCDPVRFQEKIRELADHHQDLKQAAKEDGLSEPEAEAFANRCLGEPVALAEKLAAVVRQSSWCGRHPVVAWCLLPSAAICLTVLPSLLLTLALLQRCFTPPAWSVIASGGKGFATIVELAWCIACLAFALVPAAFCRLALHSASGLKWALAACAICALHGYFCDLRVLPHALSFGYHFPSWLPDNWLLVAIPLAVALRAWWRRRALETHYQSLALASSPTNPSTPVSPV